MRTKGLASGLAAALLFGAAAPVVKLVLPGSSPFMLAGLLYLGAGAALLPALLFNRGPAREAPLRRSDAPTMLGMILAGGVAGPLLLLFGLQRLSAVPASLLLNLEAPFTMLLAVAAFGEHLGGREWAGALAVVAAAALLGLGPGEAQLSLSGSLAVAGACAAWALDNNLAARLSLKDPVAVVRLKALPAGAFNLIVAFALGERLPPAATLIPVLITGALGYGLSIVLNLKAVRELGAARQAALFSTAPFAGAALAVPLLHEHLRWLDAGAAALMAAGVAGLLIARHAHEHAHQSMAHEHSHVHDEHHQHSHTGSEGPEPHGHAHQHEARLHSHPHVSDAHHKHGHKH